MKKKVLVLGIGQSNYILQLYSTIKAKLPDFSFSISGLKALFKNEDVQRANEIFDEQFNLENIEWSLWQKIKTAFFICTKKFIYKEMALLFLEGNVSFRNIKEVVIGENVLPFLRAKEINKSHFSVLHFHFITAYYSAVIKYLKKDFAVIGTFWGSDLMRTAGHKQYYYQTLLLERATIITCATYDMANIVLSKYGRHLENKIRYAKFIHDDEIYKWIDIFRNRNDWQNDFRNKYSIPLNNKIVIIGHNATPENNHLKIIESFQALDPQIQATFTCVLPLSYAGWNKEHLRALKNCSKEYAMQFVFLEDYLTWQELAQLKLIADVMIHMPKSDGLSAALTEYFYAGGVVVTASWLPYSTFLQEGLFYFQYDNFDDLKNFWTNIFTAKPAYEGQLKKNIEIVRQVFDINNIATSWQRIFNELSV